MATFLVGVSDLIGTSELVTTGVLGANTVAVATFGPIGLVATASMSRGISRDVKHGSTRNTSEAIVGSMCALGGGVAGAAQGAKLGTMLYPGVGTAVGAAAGSLLGAGLADYAGKQAASDVFDHYEYDIKIFRCNKCDHRFKCRVYTDQSRSHCPHCDDEFVIELC